MHRLVLLSYVAASTLLVTGAIQAQETPTFVGEWYGVLETPRNRNSRELSALRPRPLPTSLEISRAGDGSYAVKQVSISQKQSEIPVTTVTVEGNLIYWSAPAVNGWYEGQLSPDGSIITGSWTQHGSTHPLDFERVDS